MLKRNNRIFSRKEFEEVKVAGYLYRGGLISGLILKKNDKEKRFGIIVSKKISKKAVERNKVRRLVYLAVRENMEKFSEGLRVIFLVRPEIINKKYEEVGAEMLNLVQKIPVERI